MGDETQYTYIGESRREDGYSRDDSKGPFRADEELLQVVPCTCHQYVRSAAGAGHSPVLSFLNAPALPPGMPTDKTVPFPSAKTASIPSTVPCRLPYLSSRSPPALVERFPAIWQDPFAPRSRGIMYPFGARKLERTSRIAPPSDVRIPGRS